MKDGMFYVLFAGAGMVLGRMLNQYVCYKVKPKTGGVVPKLLQLPGLEWCYGALWGMTAGFVGNIAEGFLFSLFLSLLWGVALVDYFTYEIPLELNLWIVVLGVFRICTDVSQWWLYLLGMVSASSILLIAYLFTKKRGIGGGDIKLVAASGLVLGGTKVFLALFLGLLLSVLVYPFHRKKGENGRFFALGPYLAIGQWVMVWFGERLLVW